MQLIKLPAFNINLHLYVIVIWAIYLILSPVYVFPKGLPQPADLLLLLGILPGMMTAYLGSSCRVPLTYVAGGLFALLTVFVNWVNYIFYPDIRLLLSSLYYPYNFTVFLFVVYIFKEDFQRIKKISIYCIYAAIIMQFLWAEFFPDPGLKRMTGGFKNPNQLGYWSLLSAAMLFFLKRNEKFNLMDWASIILVALIQSLALSKAGILSFGSFLIFTSFSPQVPSIGKIIIFIGLLCTLFYAMFSPHTISNLNANIEAFERVTDRLGTIGKENDDSPEGRGYNRIVNNPEYLIVGAGEGAFVRFRTWASSNELHSGFATILFSYGIIGFSLFAAFLFFIFYKQPWYCIGILFSVLLFSVSSQTIRFTHTWVFLGIGYATYMLSGESSQETFVKILTNRKWSS